MKTAKIDIHINKKNIGLGFLFVLLGIMAPWVINVENFRIYDLLTSCIEDGDTGRLVIAGFKLIILNSVRALPHYMGAFVIAESIMIRYEGKTVDFLRGVVAIIIIPAVYKLIFWIYGINYHFGIPALIVILFIIYLEKLNYTTIKMMNKAFIIVLLLLGVQWMDIIPALSQYGFGRGETSYDVKLVASFIEGTDILSLAAISFSSIFIFNAFLIMKILSEEHKLNVVMEENRRVELELAESRMKALEARTSQEIHNLVHDLKTPLTSIQALAGISEMVEKDKKIKNHLGKIVDAVEVLNKMISEILYEDRKSAITTEELFSYVLSQVSSHQKVSKLFLNNEIPQKRLYANKIRLSRALINGIENAFYAIDFEKGVIKISVKSKDRCICISIEDNGIGIGDETIKNIWDNGFSTKNSTGLGLNFIQNVVHNHNGSVKITSQFGEGTCLEILLPEVMADG